MRKILVPILVALALICLIGTASAVNITAEGSGTIPAGAVITHWGTASTYPYGVAYGDGYVWYVDDDQNKIYKCYPNGTQITSYVMIGDGFGLTWENDSGSEPYLWYTDYPSSKIYKLYANNGTEALNFSSPETFPSGLAWDGEYLWVTTPGSDRIYKLYANNGTEVLNFTFTAPEDLAWDDDSQGGPYLWIGSGYDAIGVYKVYPNGTTILNFTITNPDTGVLLDGPSGVAWDGEYLWVSEWSSPYNMYKVTVAEESTSMSTSISGRIVNSTIVIGEDASCTQEDVVNITNPSAYDVSDVLVNYVKPSGAGDLNKTSDSIATLTAGASVNRSVSYPWTLPDVVLSETGQGQIIERYAKYTFSLLRALDPDTEVTLSTLKIYLDTSQLPYFHHIEKVTVNGIERTVELENGRYYVYCSPLPAGENEVIVMYHKHDVSHDGGYSPMPDITPPEARPPAWQWFNEMMQNIREWISQHMRWRR